MNKPVVIIGAGPAGLSCADALTRQNIAVVLIDDNLRAGGQYFRQLPSCYTVEPDAKLLRETKRAPALFAVLSHPLVTYLPSTTVWSSPAPLTVAYTGPNGSGRVAARAVVIATGAQDAALAFSGWTLPGVISAGGCLNLAKGHGMIPGGRVIVAGNGPLVLVAAATLVAAGADVTHVVEAQPTSKVLMRTLAGAVHAPALVAKGLGYRARLLRAGARFLSGKMVVRAEGDGAVESVSIAAVDGQTGRARGRSERLAADTLVVGYGLTPGSDFARLLGCAMTRAPELGGWVPRRSEHFETSLPSVYAVGDGAGIGGVEIAILEGRLAAAHIAQSHGMSGLRRAYERLDTFRRVLASAYRTPHALVAAADDTIICRCEELTLGELKARFVAGDANLDRLKSSSRLGMGRCQGRNCLSAAAGLLGLDSADHVRPLPRARPPARPVRIVHLIQDNSVGPAHEPDENVATANPEHLQ
jgi:NADPH-dependent 2,4-dienoyl-CoA reductase/sulfur reductase-like enzyme